MISSGTWWLLALCGIFEAAHAVTARIARGWLCALVWAAGIVLIAVIGFLRIYLGVHYPTGVIVARLAAFIWVTAVRLRVRELRGAGLRSRLEKQVLGQHHGLLTVLISVETE